MLDYFSNQTLSIKNFVKLSLEAGYKIEVFDPIEGDTLVEVCSDIKRILQTCLNMEMFSLNVYSELKPLGSVICSFDHDSFPIIDYTENEVIENLVIKCQF